MDERRPYNEDDDFSVDRLANDSSAYDPLGWYIGSTGPARSRRKSYYYYSPPAVAAQLQAVFSDPKYPVRNMDDWRRLCDVHQLQWLAVHPLTTSPVLSGELEILARDLRLESKRAVYMDLADADQQKYDEIVKIIRGRPYPELVRIVEEQIPTIRDEELRQSAEREFRQRFH